MSLVITKNQPPVLYVDTIKDWLGKGWINISPRLQDAIPAVSVAIAGKVVEIYFNAFEHSNSPIGVFSCG
ncbi:MAG: hypothetical protein HEQ24_06035 [Dolichospermum sp. BR01]|nr:hypothetical protein [Dolichospermum sp. BR01]